MTDKTTLYVPGHRKITVSKLVKRVIQVVASVGLTAGVVFVLVVGNGMLTGRGSALQSYYTWLAFMKRPDILTIMFLTALVSVLFVYWQRDNERR